MNNSTNSRILLTLIKEDQVFPLEQRFKVFLNNVEIDWESLLEEAKFHRIAPVIYKNLKAANLPSVPDYFLRNLGVIYYGNLHRNMKYFSELERILKSLKETGVEPIVLKGGAIAEKLYKNIALRPIEDIDLLVRQFDLPTTKTVFKKWGYEAGQEKIFPSKTHRDFEKEIHKPFEKFESEIHFFKSKRKYFFDIHWNLLIMCDSKLKEAIQLNMDKIWQRAKISSFGTANGYLMSSEDLLIYLCLHLRERHFEKRKSRLIWWYDIYKILKTSKDELDWDYFMASIREYNACESIYPLILTLKEWFDDITLPPDLIKDAHNYFEIFSIERILPNISKQEEFEEKHQEKEYFLELGRANGVWKKIKLLFGDIFPQKEYMIFKYRIENRKLLPFYYLLRIKDIIIKGFKATGQLLKS